MFEMKLMLISLSTWQLIPLDFENRRKVALILTCYTSVYLQWAHNRNTYNPCTMAGWQMKHGYGKYVCCIHKMYCLPH